VSFNHETNENARHDSGGRLLLSDGARQTGRGCASPQCVEGRRRELLAFSGFPEGRRTQLDFFPADPAAFKQAAKKAKWKVVGPKRGFLLQGDDRVGAVAQLLERLGSAKINVTAIDAVSVDGRYGAIFWVAPKDVKKAAAIVGAT
jgi:hypothetical protein